ncbi:MAG: hypothetical protein ABSB59_43645 [Streptosporangiaceae bacterium]|jgi:hypothetical protein
MKSPGLACPVLAAARAGSLGFLIGGYKAPDLHELVHLRAGTGYRNAGTGPARTILAGLASAS